MAGVAQCTVPGPLLPAPPVLLSCRVPYLERQHRDFDIFVLEQV
jgi:hypothetical protein